MLHCNMTPRSRWRVDDPSTTRTVEVSSTSGRTESNPPLRLVPARLAPPGLQIGEAIERGARRERLAQVAAVALRPQPTIEDRHRAGVALRADQPAEALFQRQ